MSVLRGFGAFVVRAAVLAGMALLLGGCLSANPNSGASTPPPPPPPQQQPAAATPNAVAASTVVSQAQPGATGRVISGTISWAGGAPPAGSTLFLALVKSANDPQPRTCIDAARNPVNDQGQFYAQVACAPQAGDQLSFVLIIGPAGERNWHSGVVPLPADLANVHLTAPN